MKKDNGGEYRKEVVKDDEVITLVKLKKHKLSHEMKCNNTNEDDSISVIDIRIVIGDTEHNNRLD